MSYSTKDRRTANRLKKQLEHLSGISVFVAPSDIKASREGWRKTIIKSVRESEVFLPLLTKNFRKSEWTDQETGIAVAQGKLIIPLRVGTTKPHGFLESYPYQKISPRSLEKKLPDILTQVKDDKKLREKLQWSFISCFNDSNGFPEANERSELLEELGPYDAKKANALFEGYLKNVNIHHGFTASDRIVGLLIKNRRFIKPSLVQQAREIPESERAEYLGLRRLLSAF